LSIISATNYLRIFLLQPLEPLTWITPRGKLPDVDGRATFRHKSVVKKDSPQDLTPTENPENPENSKTLNLIA
jgi:hypothetical protein